MISKKNIYDRISDKEINELVELYDSKRQTNNAFWETKYHAMELLGINEDDADSLLETILE